MRNAASLAPRIISRRANHPARRHQLRRDPRQFGRGLAFRHEPEAQPSWRLSDDLKLFAATFASGFLFVSILIG